MTFWVLWSVDAYEEAVRTYRKKFDNLDDAKLFIEELKKEDKYCDDYDYALVKGKFLTGLNEGFEEEG